MRDAMADDADWKPLLDELARRDAAAQAMGGAQKLARQHEAGRLDARQRVAARDGALRAAARLFAVQSRLRVPKLHVTLRKAYGFGSSILAMNPFDAQTLTLAFPGTSLGAMPARGAAQRTGSPQRRTRTRRADRNPPVIGLLIRLKGVHACPRTTS